MSMLLLDMGKEELVALVKGWGEPAYRAGQVYDFLRRGIAPAGMHNIPKALRERLCELTWGGASIQTSRRSEKDDTIKYLFALHDGELVEGVLMPYKHGNTFCLSTQVGCRMGCAFCASTLGGCVRNISHGEMLGMVLAAERAADAERAATAERTISNIVLMGSGEPLDNYDNVIQFLHRAVSPEGLGISARNISLSTCGMVPRMLTLAADAPPVTLCVSLHAHSDDVRDTLVPLNKKYPIADVLEAARAYTAQTGRRVIIEYALIEGVNAGDADAQALAKLLKGMLCHVNLIPLNTVQEHALRGVSRKDAYIFAGKLSALGISATLRREMGADIEGACGQLRAIHNSQ